MKILNHHVHAQIRLIFAIEFVLAMVSFVLASVLLDLLGPGTVQITVRGWLNAVLFAGLAVAGLSATGLYSVNQRHRASAVAARIIVGMLMAATGLALVNLVLPFVESRVVWLTALGIAVLVLGFGRTAMRGLLDEEIFRRRLLILGAGKRAANILQLRRRSDQRGFRIVGILPCEGDRFVLDDERVIKDHVSLLDLARRERASEIIVAPDDRRQRFPVAELLECKLSGINIIDLLEFMERETGRVKVELVSPSWMIFSDGFSQTGGSRVQVRLFDIALSSILLLATLPLMAIVALAILLDDGRPLLYRQRRVGLSGDTFELLKFRSMRHDAEAEGEAVWATKSDDRATRVGRLLRKLRFDELPQLVNVLRGDMSLVGPRPERPEFVSNLVHEIPYYHERHCIKPGVTGWAQLCYPYGASSKDALAKLEYDLYYIKNRSLIFDLIILMQTVEVVLWQKGSR